MTKEQILRSTIYLLGASGSEPAVEEYDWEMSDFENVVCVGVAAGDWLLEQCFNRTPAKKDWNKGFSELLGTDTWFNLYLKVGRTCESRKFRLLFEVNDGDRVSMYAVKLDPEEKAAFIELAEAYCRECEKMSIDEMIREAEQET